MKTTFIFFLIQVSLVLVSSKKISRGLKSAEVLHFYFTPSLDATNFSYLYVPILLPIESIYKSSIRPLLVSNKEIIERNLPSLLSPYSGYLVFRAEIQNLYLDLLSNNTSLFQFLPLDRSNEILMLTLDLSNNGNLPFELRFSLLEERPISLKTRILDSNTSNTTNSSLCGNGVLDPGEQCDDGNTISGDGCSSTCTIEPFYDCSQKNGTYCFDERPPYCLMNMPWNAFYQSVEILLVFSKNMTPINFYNQSIVSVTVSSLNNMTDFTWNYTTNDNKTYNFQIVFKVSFQSQTFSVEFLQPSMIMDTTNIPITSISYTSSIVIGEFIYYPPDNVSFFNIIDLTLSYLMIVLLFAFFPLLILDSLSIFWLYIDVLQLLNLILFVNVDMPMNAVVFFRALTPANFIKFEYLKFFDLSYLDYIDNTAIPYYFREEGFSSIFIRNAFFAMCFYGFVLIAFLSIKVFNNVLVSRLSERRICGCFVNTCGFLQELMQYSALLRLSLVLFVPLLMASVLQMLNLRFDKNGNILNSVLALACFVYLMLFFFFCFWFLNTSSIDLEDPEIDKKFLPLFDLLKKKAFFKRNFTIFYMLRKFCWVMAVVLLDAEPLNQMFLLIFWSLFITTFMFFKRPYEVDKINQLTFFTEVMILLILLLIASLQCLAYLQVNLLSIQGKLIIGWVILSIGLLLVLVKALSMIIEILINIRSLISNTKVLLQNINNNEKMSISAEGDNLMDPSYSRDGEVQAIKEVDEEEEYDEDREKEIENSKL